MGFLLYWIIVGIVAGALAKWAVPGEGPGGIVGDLIIGIIGAVLGGWIVGLFGAATGGSMLWNIIVAFIGAVVLLLIARAFTRRSAV